MRGREGSQVIGNWYGLSKLQVRNLISHIHIHIHGQLSKLEI